MKIPKHIDQKIDRLNRILEDATVLKHQIEDWAQNKGVDVCEKEWYDRVVDDISSVQGIYKEEFHEYMDEIFER